MILKTSSLLCVDPVPLVQLLTDVCRVWPSLISNLLSSHASDRPYGLSEAAHYSRTPFKNQSSPLHGLRNLPRGSAIRSIYIADSAPGLRLSAPLTETIPTIFSNCPVPSMKGPKPVILKKGWASSGNRVLNARPSNRLALRLPIGLLPSAKNLNSLLIE